VDNKASFGDEQFIYHIGMESKPVHINNILDEYVIIDDEKIPFRRRTVLNKQLSVIMPEKFAIMSKQLAEIKYPSVNRPGEIYTNSETTINFSLTHTKDAATNEGIPEIKEAFQQIITRMHPASNIIDSVVLDVSGLNIAYFDFVTPALDMDIYNVTFVFSLDKRIVVGSFNCPQESMDEWKPLLAQMLQSTEVKYNK
jgi:hypothetical protein